MSTRVGSGARLTAPGLVLLGGLANSAAAYAASEVAEASALPNLLRLSIDELADMEISSVSRRAEPLSTAAAAIYVITAGDIRLSGARTIPGALRLAPNLTVGRVDALSYAISARGFNTVEASNKLLALMDGRSLYSPLHSGVFWETHDMMLDDLERIEVISGSGGTLWGANAVNGVINIITKSSRDTQGIFLKAGGGNMDQSFAARYGGQFGDPLTYRVYLKGYRTGDSRTGTGASAQDSLSKLQAGFRADWESTDDVLTVQGDMYNGSSDDGAGVSLRGGNAAVTWNRRLGETELRVKGYFGRSTRTSPGVFDRVDSYDAELQHNFNLGAHEVVWGGGFRRNIENFTNTLNIFHLDPAMRALNHGNIYVQDTYALTPALRLIAGVKMERNDFTGWEVMPSARVAWQAADTALLWAAVSRAVRTPNRIDRELVGPPILIAATGFMSEQLLSYEAGYRGQLGGDVTLSVSVFYNEYDDVRTTGLAPGGNFPIRLENARYGHTYGTEAWGTYRAADWWRMDVGIASLQKSFKVKAGHVDLIPNQHLGNDPDYQASLRSTFFIGQDVDITAGLRVMDDLPSPVVPSYAELDARVAWRPIENVELSLSGENLFDRRHPEVGDVATRREVPRMVYATVRWAH